MNEFHFDFEHFLQTSPEYLIGFLFNLGTIIIILAVTYLVLKGLHRILFIIEEKQFISPPFVHFFHSVLKWAVLICAILLIMQQVGIKLNSLWTVISAITAMVAIGFVAVWSVLSNFLCTLMLIIFHPFRIGDDIEIIDPAMTSGISGNVRNINLIFTSLRSMDADTGDPVETHIPNNLFFQKILRMKGGNRTFSLDKQLFEEKSLLRTKKKEN